MILLVRMSLYIIIDKRLFFNCNLLLYMTVFILFFFYTFEMGIVTFSFWPIYTPLMLCYVIYIYIYTYLYIYMKFKLVRIETFPKIGS